MNLTGDAKGIEDLREIKEKKVEYLKFLLTSAKTNFDRTVNFTSIDGKINYKLLFDPIKNVFNIEPVP